MEKLKKTSSLPKGLDRYIIRDSEENELNTADTFQDAEKLVAKGLDTRNADDDRYCVAIYELKQFSVLETEIKTTIVKP